MFRVGVAVVASRSRPGTVAALAAPAVCARRLSCMVLHGARYSCRTRGLHGALQTLDKGCFALRRGTMQEQGKVRHVAVIDIKRALCYGARLKIETAVDSVNLRRTTA